MRRRQPPLQSLLSRTRGHDHSSRSDEELHAAVRCLQDRGGETSQGELLAECFAVVAEAIDRRLGGVEVLRRTLDLRRRCGG